MSPSPDTVKIPLVFSPEEQEYHEPKGFYVNLLANSLIAKLKHRTQSADGNALFAKPPLSKKKNIKALESSALTRLSRPERRSAPPLTNVSQSRWTIDTHTGTSSSLSAKNNQPEISGRSKPEEESSSNEKFPEVTPGRSYKSDRRRSTSAGRLGSFSSRATADFSSSETGTSTRRRFLCGSAYSVDSRAADCRVKVVKERDGIFKPADKYASPRHILREPTFTNRKPACDYEMYFLPYSCEDNTVHTDPSSPLGYQTSYKKRMKVSWSAAHHQVDMISNASTDEPMPESQPSFSVSRSNKSSHVDNMAFKRPAYTTGRHQISSIGVKWEVPDAVILTDDTKEEIKKEPKALKLPMWSWLVTQTDSRQQQRLLSSKQSKSRKDKFPVSRSLHSAVSSKKADQSKDIRIKHSRDVHPVSTAMNREGTSISKTKWTVPSSTTNSLDPEKTALERLSLVKRTGARLLYEPDMDVGRGQRLGADDNFELPNLNNENSRGDYRNLPDSNKSAFGTEATTTQTQSSPRKYEQSPSPSKSHKSVN